MIKRSALGMLALVMMIVSLQVLPASAAILVPQGTKVGLTFLTPVNPTTGHKGDQVHFQVAADVIVDRHVVIRNSTMLTGTINQVGHPSIANQAFAVISFLAVPAVDKQPIRLKDIRVSAGLFGGNLNVKPGQFVQTTTLSNAHVSFK